MFVGAHNVGLMDGEEEGLLAAVLMARQGNGVAVLFIDSKGSLRRVY